MDFSREKHATLRRRVEDRMLDWKCKIENPRKGQGPIRVTSFSETQSPNSQTLQEKLPKLVAFEIQSSGGGGAPRRTPSGRIQTELRGHPDIRFHQRDNSVFEQSMRYQLDKEGIRRYKEELDKQLAERKKEFPENEYTKGSDLATLISDGKSAQGMRRWESLPKLSSTDITRSYVISPRTPDPAEYKRGLELQLEKKRLIQAENERREQALNSLHFSAFDSFWGKPGAGAPKTSNRKEKLFDLLHNNSSKGSSSRTSSKEY